MKNTSSSSTKIGISIIGVLFFIFGAITWLNATLIPYLRVACELNDFQSYFVTFAFYISYFVMSLPSAGILKKTGLKNGMMLGLIVMAAGALFFIPAALTRSYPLFLLGLFVMGTGLALLQTASNPYVIELGPIESAAQRMSIMGICNKVAGIISPFAVGAIVLKGIDDVSERLSVLTDATARAVELDLLAHKVILPYVIIMLLLLALGIFVKFSPLPELQAEDEESGEKSGNSIFQFPYFWFGVLALFVYVGVEVIAVDTIISYGEELGFSMEQAKSFTMFPLLAMVVGYLLGIVCIPKYISQERSLMTCCLLGIVFTVGTMFSSGVLAIICMSLLGLAHSIMWPAIFPMAINGLGKFTKLGSAILIMAIAGGALIPLLYGYLADITSRQHAYWIMLPCYVIILAFAATGVKLSKASLKEKSA